MYCVATLPTIFIASVFHRRSSVNMRYDLPDGQLRVFEPFVVEGRSAAECYMNLYSSSNHFCKKPCLSLSRHKLVTALQLCFTSPRSRGNQLLCSVWFCPVEDLAGPADWPSVYGEVGRGGCLFAWNFTVTRSAVPTEGGEKPLD